MTQREKSASRQATPRLIEKWDAKRARMFEFFSGDRFMPRRLCGDWWDGYWQIAFISDIVIGLSYFALAAMLVFGVVYVRRSSIGAKLIPRGQVRLVFYLDSILFATFILSCGTGHLIDAEAYYTARYHLMSIQRAVTAIVSMLTVPAVWITVSWLRSTMKEEKWND